MSWVEFILHALHIYILLICQACHNNLPSSWYVYHWIWNMNGQPHHAIDQERPKKLTCIVERACVHHKLLYIHVYEWMSGRQGIGMLTHNFRNVKSGRWYFQKSIFWRHMFCTAVANQATSPFILHAENVHKTSPYLANSLSTFSSKNPSKL